MPEENKNLEIPLLKIIRRIVKWSGMFLIAIFVLAPIFSFMLPGLMAIMGLRTWIDYGPVTLGSGIILILIERILRKPSFKKMMIFILIILIIIFFLKSNPFFFTRLCN